MNKDESAQEKANEQKRAEIDKMLRGLTYREREIIKLRYGLGDGYIYTLKEVGHIFKVNRERIRHIEQKAIQKLNKISETSLQEIRERNTES